MTTEYADYGQNSAVYHDISPKAVLATRVFGVVTAILTALALLFCLVEGSDNKNLYFQATNIIISSLVALVIAAWYRSGTLGADKFWFVILTCCVLIMQSLMTDILVFNYPTMKESSIVTPSPSKTPTTKPSG